MVKRAFAGLLVVAAAPIVSMAQVPAGPEFHVNVFTSREQDRPSIAADGQGRFVVAWESYTQDGASGSIVARRFDASGAPLGAEFVVNATTASFQYGVSVGANARGEFVIAWSTFDSSYGVDVFAQRFDASGARQGAEIVVNAGRDGDQSRPSVALDAAGNFVVAWHDGRNYPGTREIFAQRFDATGARRGAEFQVNTFTLYHQQRPRVASDAAGNFIVTWDSPGREGSGFGIAARRYDSAGNPLGDDFVVNSTTLSDQRYPSAASDARGNLVVVWQSAGQDGSLHGVYGQRYDPFGNPQGGEFRVNAFTTGSQLRPVVASDAFGNFVVAWESNDVGGSAYDVVAQRFDAAGAKRGIEFRANSSIFADQKDPAVASDPAGNFVIGWSDSYREGGGDALISTGLYAQRYGGVVPAALAVDPAGNGIFEPGETVQVITSWRNVNGLAQDLFGNGASFTGPPGPTYGFQDNLADYDLVPSGTTRSCLDFSDCFTVSVSAQPRPATHFDTVLREDIFPQLLGQAQGWTLHLGDSFEDVPRTSGFYRFVETMLHHGVTGGCGTAVYCPGGVTNRQQMAVFVLAAKDGAPVSVPPCAAPPFADVPAGSPFCPFIAELARRGVVGGCGGGNFCPGNAVTRQETTVFALATLDPTFTPPACTVPPFEDVGVNSPFCAHIAELARRGVIAGCGSSNFCPANPVTRQEMAVIISGTFGLALYGP
jgi:hypothetical protein